MPIESPKNPFVNQVAQIQVQALDNGFIVQAVNIDGKNKSVRLVAMSIPELRERIHDVAEVLFEIVEQEEKPADGPAGAKDTPGTETNPAK